MKFDNIFLIGMMGSGKSTVGKLLSQKIGLSLLDIDNELESIMDMSISQIFNDYGEKRFRLIESTFFRECTKLNDYIFATGGGIILDENNQLILKNRGLTFFLDCSTDVIYQRIKKFRNKSDSKILRFIYGLSLISLWIEIFANLSLYDPGPGNINNGEFGRIYDVIPPLIIIENAGFGTWLSIFIGTHMFAITGLILLGGVHFFIKRKNK